MALPPNYLFVNPKDGRLVSQSYLQVPGGTSTVPSISFIDSANSGLSCDASGVVSIISAGSQKVTVGSTTTINSPISLTDALSFPLGTAALPSLYPGTDTNTGIYSPGADQVAISTGGTGRLFVDASGRVGIGTSSPSALLDVAGATNPGIQITNSATDSASIVYETAANALNVSAYNPSSGSYRGVRIRGSSITLQTTASASLSTAVTIDSSQRVGIGTTSPAGALHVNSASSTAIINEGGNYSSFDSYAGGVRKAFFQWSNVDNAIIINALPASSTLRFSTVDVERLRIDSSGRLLVGTSTARSNFYNFTNTTPRIQNEATNANDAAYASIFGGAAGSGAFVFARHRGSIGQYTVVQTGDTLGRLSYQGADGAEFVEAAYIAAEVDGTPGADDMPGRLVFSTTADGASSPTERMRITSTGSVEIGTTVVGNPSYLFVRSSGGETAFFDRQTSDGVIIALRQDNTTEGTISVSGTTVSYNGGHLSRWSQLPNGAERTEILRGSVLSNIDEMCEWGEEDNEQLNRMKVSDVEGDKNVSGVFQAWDDDDDTYTDDFYCAMTGDFIIRIAGNVTVERGDLLMSAGDGTAKPQDDDIIRSKTIAKVTSTNVSCTYPDGSYCVPCVLMAC